MRMTRISTQVISLSVLSACAPEPEIGIDRTVLEGTIQITPELIIEDENIVGLNDAIFDNPETEEVIESAQDLGMLGHRYSLVDGRCHTFSAERDGPPTGDFDYYLFKAQYTGTISVGLTWEDVEVTDPEAPPAEEMIWHLNAYDIEGLSDPEAFEELEEGEFIELFDGNTEGNYGWSSFSMDVIAGASYAVRVAGRRALGDSDAYRLSLSGFDPNGWDDGSGKTTGAATILVGAYTQDDVTERGNPVGGTSVESFSFDEDTLTWSGEYTMWYIRSVTTTEIGIEPETENTVPTHTDTGQDETGTDESEDVDTNSNDTGVDDTGTHDTGTHDTGTHDTGTHDTGINDTGADDTGGIDTGSSTGGDSDGDNPDDDSDSEPDPEPEYATVVDGNLCEVWVYAGTFPNLNSGIPSGTLFSSTGTHVTLDTENITKVTVEVDTIQPKMIGWTYAEQESNDPDYDAENDQWAAGANDPGITSGPGFVDIITGTIEMTGAAGYGEHDEDLFIVTVPSDVYLSVILDWDSADDIDYYVLGPRDGDPVADYEDDSDYYAQPEFGVTRDLLHPGETYYIWVAGYAGTDGSVANYTVELEYLSP